MATNHNATLGVMTDQGPEERRGLPVWAIILIVVVVIALIVLIVYLLVRNSARMAQKRATAGVRDDTLDSLMRERQRLLGSPVEI